MVARVFWSLLIIAVAVSPARAESLSYAQVLQRAVDNSDNVQIAWMELKSTRLETVRVESRLGWVASGGAGVAHDLNIFGTPVDRVQADANLDRKLESGSSVGFGVAATHEDAESSFFPLLPNPSQTVSVDARYRVPLRQGSDNTDYQQGLVTADAGVEAAQAAFRATRNQLAEQVTELFYSAALTHARLQNANEAIGRASRLRAFVLRNVRLGIAEEKDRLQVEAQLRARLAEQRALQATWDNQRIALNRLMKQDWQHEWQPRVLPQPTTASLDVSSLQKDATDYSPTLQREMARIRAADATIERRRDAMRDKVDLVFSVGGRRTSGDTATGSVSETEPVAGIRLEYRVALDGRGSDAELTQAYLDRDIAHRRYDTGLTDIRYTVVRLVTEIDALDAALEQARAREEAERKKLDEANRRYRTGRANTAELIQFENDYEAAVFALDQQTIELARRHRALEQLSGTIWQGIATTLPEPGMQP